MTEWLAEWFIQCLTGWLAECSRDREREQHQHERQCEREAQKTKIGLVLQFYHEFLVVFMTLARCGMAWPRRAWRETMTALTSGHLFPGRVLISFHELGVAWQHRACPRKRTVD